MRHKKFRQNVLKLLLDFGFLGRITPGMYVQSCQSISANLFKTPEEFSCFFSKKEEIPAIFEQFFEAKMQIIF